MFRRRNPEEALAYYLGFNYHAVKGADARFVSEWGLATQLRDLRVLVRRAGAGGRKVILGGHSAGASTAVAYAAWDFGGHPGYREIDGLVLIDGGLLGSFAEANANARAGSSPRSAAATCSSTCSASGCLRSPGSSPRSARSTRTSVPTNPRRCRTSRCCRPSSSRLSASRTRPSSATRSTRRLPRGARADPDSGRRAGGERRPAALADGELTPIRRFAQAYAASDPNAIEWYYPRRLLLDIDAANDLRQNAAARVVGLRLLHGRQIDVPLYAFSTSLTKGAVARGARRLARIAPIPRDVVVDDRRTSHLDPLSAAPRTNHFLKTVVPFLKRTVR